MTTHYASDLLINAPIIERVLKRILYQTICTQNWPLEVMKPYLLLDSSDFEPARNENFSPSY